MWNGYYHSFPYMVFFVSVIILWGRFKQPHPIRIYVIFDVTES